MKAKLTFFSFFAVATLLAIPAHAQDFLKRLKPWLYPDDSLDALGVRESPFPDLLRGRDDLRYKRPAHSSHVSPA